MVNPSRKTHQYKNIPQQADQREENGPLSRNLWKSSAPDPKKSWLMMFDAAFSCILIVCHSCTLHIVLKMPNQLETIGCARLIVRGHPLPFFLVDVVDVHGAYCAYGCIWCILGQVCASYFVSIELTQLTQLTHSTRLAPGTSFASIGRWGSCEPCQQKLLQLLAAKRSKQTQVPIDWSYLRTYHT